MLVAHSTAALAVEHLADPDAAVPVLLAAQARLLGLVGQPRRTDVQRWSFAKPSSTRESTYLLTDDLVGACGDGWASTPKVEGAYLSGLELGHALAERLG